MAERRARLLRARPGSASARHLDGHRRARAPPARREISAQLILAGLGGASGASIRGALPADKDLFTRQGRSLARWMDSRRVRSAKTLSPEPADHEMWGHAHRGPWRADLGALEERAVVLGHHSVRLYTNRSLDEASDVQQLATGGRRYNDDPFCRSLVRSGWVRVETASSGRGSGYPNAWQQQPAFRAPGGGQQMSPGMRQVDKAVEALGRDRRLAAVDVWPASESGIGRRPGGTRIVRGLPASPHRHRASKLSSGWRRGRRSPTRR
jgi:hypothetical protein